MLDTIIYVSVYTYLYLTLTCTNGSDHLQMYYAQHPGRLILLSFIVQANQGFVNAYVYSCVICKRFEVNESSS